MFDNGLYQKLTVAWQFLISRPYSPINNFLLSADLLLLQIRLGPAGIEEFYPLGVLSTAEAEGLRTMKAELLSSIQKGIEFATKL